MLKSDIPLDYSSLVSDSLTPPPILLSHINTQPLRPSCSLNKPLHMKCQWDACYQNHFVDDIFFFIILVKFRPDYIFILMYFN